MKLLRQILPVIAMLAATFGQSGAFHVDDELAMAAAQSHEDSEAPSGPTLCDFEESPSPYRPELSRPMVEEPSTELVILAAYPLNTRDDADFRVCLCGSITTTRLLI
jgi:hypothetical protein